MSYANMPEKSMGIFSVRLADGTVNPAVIERVSCDVEITCSAYTKACNGPAWGFNFVGGDGNENEICFDCFERLDGAEMVMGA
jgi:hypothetical protein